MANVQEKFDETVEVFYPEEWIGYVDDFDNPDEDLIVAENLINETESAFSTLLDRSEEKCRKVWEMILFNDFREVKLHFFNQIVDYDKSKVSYLLENEMFEVFQNVEYDGGIESSAQNFAKAMHNMLIDEL